MITLPIVEREMRVATRRQRTYWIRLGGAALACGVTAWMLVRANVALPPAQAGASLFSVLSSIAFAACLMAGALLTADCISEEKREGTLGLLFLTDLKGRDVIFGKLVATSVHAFYALLGTLPLMAIPFLLGGMTQGELWRMALVLVNTLFCSLAVGLLISTLSVRERRAMLVTALVLVGIGLGFHYLGGVVRSISLRRAYDLAFEGPFAARPARFYLSCAWVHALGWLMLVAACRRVPQSWQEQTTRPAVAPDEALTLWPVVDEETGEPLPLGVPPLRDGNPIKWLADRDGRTPVWMWVTLVLAGLAWVMVHPVFNAQRTSVELALVGGVLFHAILKCWIAWEATLRFAADRRCGALEVLLSTPLTVRQILSGQLTSLFNLYLKPLLAVAVVDLALVMSGSQSFGGGRGAPVLTLAVLVMLLTFALDVAAVAVLGLWLGLKSRRANAPLVQTVGRVMLVPTFVFAVMVAVLLSAGGPRTLQSYGVGLAALWFAIGALNAGWCIAGALGGLSDRFRELATLQVVETARRRAGA